MWQVIGQDRVLSLLKCGIEQKNLAHAYLLTGPPHVGKMTMALNMAQALNCPSQEVPCGSCDSCQRIAQRKHVDVQVIGLNDANNGKDRQQVEISIDQIKELLHSANLPPFEGKHKVYIIDGAEQLSLEAANCLLKTLEEPLPGVIFILLTSNDKLLPATVVSRCQKLDLSPLPAPEVESALVNRWNTEQQKARLLANLSHGCLGWAVSAAADDSVLQQRQQRFAQLFDIIDTDFEAAFAYAAQLADQFGKSRTSTREVFDLWVEFWRDLLLIKAGQLESVTGIDHLDRLVEVSKKYQLRQIRDFIASIIATRTQLEQNANPRLALEVLMLNLPRREGQDFAARNI